MIPVNQKIYELIILQVRKIDTEIEIEQEERLRLPLEVFTMKAKQTIFTLTIVFVVSIINFAFTAPISDGSDITLSAKLEKSIFNPANTNDGQKLTSLFIKSTKDSKIKFTMLVAYNDGITQNMRQITQKEVTPLIFSVSALPLEATDFNPEEFVFSQKGHNWSPKHSKEALDMFALSVNHQFGGILHESQIHQGVIVLPEWFDLQKPIEISYRGYSNQAYFTFR